MERLHAVIGPLNTNVYVLADAAHPRGHRDRHGHARACHGSPSALDERGWTLKLIVSTHGHWDHVGENAAVAEHTGAPIAIHPADNHYLLDPQPLFAPFPIIPSVPAVELAEGGEVRFGDIRLRVLAHAGPHRRARCACQPRTEGLLFSGRHAVPRRLGAGGPAQRVGRG